MQQTIDIPSVATSPRTINVFVITRVLSLDSSGIMSVNFGFLVYIIRYQILTKPIKERSWMIHEVNLELLQPVLSTGKKNMWLLA